MILLNPIFYGFNNLHDILCFSILMFCWPPLVSKSSPLTWSIVDCPSQLIHFCAGYELLILEDYEIHLSVISTCISAGYMQTMCLADGSAEAGSEPNIEVEHYY